MKLYVKYIRLLLKSQTQYKASFIMTVITQFIQPLSLFFGIFLLFERFGDIQGWTLFEVFISYAIVGMCFSIATCFARGFDTFANMIRTASFDRVMVRPRGTVLQVLGANFDIKRIGHFLQAVIVLVIAIVGGNVQWDVVRVIMLVNMIFGGSVIFSGIYMLQATAAFWTVEGLEVGNIFSHGIKEHAVYPLDIFPRGLTIFLTFVIPFGTITYLPLQYLLGRIDGVGWLYALLPLAGALFILPCIAAWRFGVKKYTSAGS